MSETEAALFWWSAALWQQRTMEIGGFPQNAGFLQCLCSIRAGRHVAGFFQCRRCLGIQIAHIDWLFHSAGPYCSKVSMWRAEIVVGPAGAANGFERVLDRYFVDMAALGPLKVRSSEWSGPGLLPANTMRSP
ncbi:hypothetical protein [Bradyrhizobium sp. JYMT SZCCT0428]|uniref:hypothetical protein n=1 Tax=Bradyrhizobium sp. JYMT SZCCT0428 TaxID=2807673 RepID=UPI001BA549F5|nr:hypothetical protein [Bradyrhizobium sp. JYMT SZCCT0428]MBR1149276.1 hypothetical protein [Bradyrhizobium sp. JYMT SZCCT0428]